MSTICSMVDELKQKIDNLQLLLYIGHATRHFICSLVREKLVNVSNSSSNPGAYITWNLYPSSAFLYSLDGDRVGLTWLIFFWTILSIGTSGSGLCWNPEIVKLHYLMGKNWSADEMGTSQIRLIYDTLNAISADNEIMHESMHLIKYRLICVTVFNFRTLNRRLHISNAFLNTISLKVTGCFAYQLRVFRFSDANERLSLTSDFSYLFINRMKCQCSQSHRSSAVMFQKLLDHMELFCPLSVPFYSIFVSPFFRILKSCADDKLH